MIRFPCQTWLQFALTIFSLFFSLDNGAYCWRKRYPISQILSNKIKISSFLYVCDKIYVLTPFLDYLWLFFLSIKPQLQIFYGLFMWKSRDCMLIKNLLFSDLRFFFECFLMNCRFIGKGGVLWVIFFGY